MLASVSETYLRHAPTSGTRLAERIRNYDPHGIPLAVHLDVNQHEASLPKAMELGTGRNQLSIWDIKNEKEILTGGTGR
jgi:hypothetical protein